MRKQFGKALNVWVYNFSLALCSHHFIILIQHIWTNLIFCKYAYAIRQASTLKLLKMKFPDNNFSFFSLT